MKGQQKTSFATATSKVFQTDDLYARQISSVDKITLSDGTDLLKLITLLHTTTETMSKTNETLVKQVQDLTLKVKELQDKVDSFEVE